MHSKLFKSETLEMLSQEINEWSADMQEHKQHLFDTNDYSSLLDFGITEAPVRMRIDATQQFTIGEVDRSALSLNGPQNVKYIFCVLIFYYYERF
jgi:hypothetical protein